MTRSRDLFSSLPHVSVMTWGLTPFFGVFQHLVEGPRLGWIIYLFLLMIIARGLELDLCCSKGQTVELMGSLLNVLSKGQGSNSQSPRPHLINGPCLCKAEALPLSHRRKFDISLRNRETLCPDWCLLSQHIASSLSGLACGLDSSVFIWLFYYLYSKQWCWIW